MEQSTAYWTTVKVLTRVETLNIERACNIIKTLNNTASLFERFTVEAVRRSKFLLVLAQVVTTL